jgi:serine/threonine-protein kinase RsbT
MPRKAGALSTQDTESIVVPLRSDEDVVRLRQAVRECLVLAGFSLIDQTKTVTAASELARNTLRYGGGGESHIVRVSNGSRHGLRLTFIDHGPGIPDVALALTDGYTSAYRRICDPPNNAASVKSITRDEPLSDASAA